MSSEQVSFKKIALGALLVALGSTQYISSGPIVNGVQTQSYVPISLPTSVSIGGASNYGQPFLGVNTYPNVSLNTVSSVSSVVGQQTGGLLNGGLIQGVASNLPLGTVANVVNVGNVAGTVGNVLNSVGQVIDSLGNIVNPGYVVGNVANLGNVGNIVGTASNLAGNVPIVGTLGNVGYVTGNAANLGNVVGTVSNVANNVANIGLIGNVGGVVNTVGGVINNNVPLNSYGQPLTGGLINVGDVNLLSGGNSNQGYYQGGVQVQTQNLRYNN